MRCSAKKEDGITFKYRVKNNVSHKDHALPRLYQDSAFWGMTTTQFLGAFNDSVFKQIVLLLCVAVIVNPLGETQDQQFLAQGIFAIAFIFLSGISGYWSDRGSKRGLIIFCKLLEIIVMLGAVVAFANLSNIKMIATDSGAEQFSPHGTPWLLLSILFLMGSQSAVFGPAKYGILPEMVRGTDLPRMNGIIQMTTFLAIILGTWVGGVLLDAMHDFLWAVGMICVGIAIVGTMTSLLVRRTPVAEPNARFFWSNLAISPDARNILRRDKPLRNALWVYSIFWFVAAIFPLMVNWLGREQFLMSNSKTSFLLATVSVGIASGFVCAGKLSGGHINFRLVKIGALGLAVCLLLLALPASMSQGKWNHLLGVRGSYVTLIFSGFFAGLFALPVQVYLQARPPQNIKGRVIGAMNLVNWIAIVLAALFFFVSDELLKVMHLPKFIIFGITGILLFPIAFFYRSDTVSLGAESDDGVGDKQA